MDKNTELLKNIFAGVDGGRMPYEQTFYPPRQAWGALSPEKVLALWRERAASAPGIDSRLYIHFPFCERICRFCGFNAVKVRDQAQVERYLAALKKEMRLVAGRVRGMRFNQLCMGGGTPSLLTPRQLSGLFSEINSCFAFNRSAKDYGIEIECHPDSLTFEKIRAMAKCGITHVALGIQSLDDKVLALNGRTQDNSRLSGLYKCIKDSGIPYTAVEMLCGLKGQTEGSFLKDIATMVKWRPNRIFLFDFQPCSRTSITGGEGDAHGINVHRMWNKAADLTKKAGYEMKGHFATLDQGGRLWPDSFDNTMNGESIVGLGIGSISHVFGACRYQNTVNLADYLSKAESGVLPVAVGVELSRDDSMRYHVLDCLTSASGSLDPAEFRQIFGRSLDSVFKKELDCLLGLKVLARIRDSYYVCDRVSAPFELKRAFYSKAVIAALKARPAAAEMFQSSNPRLSVPAGGKNSFAAVNLSSGDGAAFARALVAARGGGLNRLALLVDEKSLPKAGTYAQAAARYAFDQLRLVYSSDEPAPLAAAAHPRFSGVYAVCAENKFGSFLKKWRPEFSALKTKGIAAGLVYALHKGNAAGLPAALDWAAAGGLAEFMVLQPCLGDPALMARIGGARNVLPVAAALGLIAPLRPGKGKIRLTLNHLPVCSKEHSGVKKYWAQSEIQDICGDRKIKTDACLNCIGGEDCGGLDVSYIKRFG
ncbi:MAG TPA: radical SAM protein [Elusimicrobiales bacterium]|mgnify:CR=1 FL=1|nr:radical SAM protein [Elusimicrobiales bacterium]